MPGPDQCSSTSEASEKKWLISMIYRLTFCSPFGALVSWYYPVPDLSSAFDTVNHSILTDVLRRRFGVDGSALSWMAEFLNNRRQVVYAGKTASDNIALQFSIPQGSVSGLSVFVQYAEDVTDIFQHHDVGYSTVCLLTTCRITAVDARFCNYCLGLRAVSPTSTSGVAPTVYSSMPTRQSCCGSVICQLPSQSSIPSTSTSV